jgi:TolB-like protein
MESSASPAVFLSYASQDADPARRLAAALRAAQVEVWFDHTELRGGDSWDARSRREINECALFVPLISANTEARAEGYFRFEWRLAEQRTQRMGRKAFLVPVCFDQIDEPGADVPESFLTVQWTHLADGTDALSGFAARIRTLLSVAAACRPAAPAAAPASAPIAPREKSVAVLAFANLSGDPQNEYFSDGITEELLNLLARVPGLSVTARTSAFFFKNKSVPVPEIAQRLGVAYVVEGSVRRAGSRVRITAQLIEAAGGFHVWSQSFDRELTDIFALQDEIAAAIAAKLELTVVAPADRGAANPEVHRLVLQGRFWWNEFTVPGFAEAERLFKTALEIEPCCADASAGLANVWCRRAILTSAASQFIEEPLREAETHARAALQADAHLAEPHAVLGTVAHMRGHVTLAEREFAHALRLNPNSDLTLVYHARLLACQGRPDLAVEELERGHRLSPVVGAFAGHRATVLIACHRYDEAIAILDDAERLGAGSMWTQALWGLALARLGRRDEIPAKLGTIVAPVEREAWMLGMSAFIRGIAAWAYADSGATVEAQEIIAALRQQPARWDYAIGLPLAILGDPEAFPALERFPQWFRDSVMMLGEQHDAIAAHPRFDDALRMLGARDAFDTLKQTVRGDAAPGRAGPGSGVRRIAPRRGEDGDPGPPSPPDDTPPPPPDSGLGV